MKLGQKTINEKIVQGNTQSVYKRGLIQKIYKETYSADVLLVEAGQSFIKHVPISRAVPSKSLTVGSRCLLMTMDPTNPQDTVVTAVYSGLSGYPNSAIGYNGAPSQSEGAGTWTTITKTAVKISTGPGKVKCTVHGSNYMSGGGVSIGLRVKATLYDAAGNNVATLYGPSSTGWQYYSNEGSSHKAWSFSWIFDVPEGVQLFELQFKGISGTASFDSNDRAMLLVEEMV